MTTQSKQERIPLSVPELRGNEWKYVKDCLDTNWVSSVGRYVSDFERRLAETVHTDHAVATVNGTAALHIALLVCGVKPGDEVLTSSLTFIAPANAIRYCGAFPVLVDCEPEHWQMDVELVAGFLRNQCRSQGDEVVNRSTGRRLAAIMPVHILGHPVDMDPLMALAEEFELPVIEDASESLGASYKSHPVGSLGTVACFSFNGNKLITTGGGGMLVSNQPQLAERARYLTTQAKDDPIEYVHGAVGYNYRLTNLLAALGVAQLEQLDNYVARKVQIATTYDAAFAQHPGISPQRTADWAAPSHWLYTVLINAELCNCDRRELMEFLQARGIESRPLWQPLHLSPVHGTRQMLGGGVSDSLNQTALSIPCSVGLTDEQQQRVIDAVLERTSLDG